MQAANGSGYRQARGCEAARAEGQGYASEKADFGITHVQSGTDLVGADWERRLAAAPSVNQRRIGYNIVRIGNVGLEFLLAGSSR